MPAARVFPSLYLLLFTHTHTHTKKKFNFASLAQCDGLFEDQT